MSSQDPNFPNGVVTLHAAGILVPGTSTGAMPPGPLSPVEADISTHHSWYAIYGILVDGMMNFVGCESYYSQLTAYAKTLGYYVVENLGRSRPH